MSNNQQQASPEKVRIEEGKITPPPVQRLRTDNTNIHSYEKKYFIDTLVKLKKVSSKLERVVLSVGEVE